MTMQNNKIPLSQRLKTAFDMSGFNPNTKENFGAGFMCGMLFIFDMPFAILSIIWNFFFGIFFSVKSVGVVAFKEIYNEKSTVGGIIGFVLMGVGVGGWFNTAKILGPDSSMTFQQLWIVLAIIFASINLVGAFYVYYKDRQYQKYWIENIITLYMPVVILQVFLNIRC